MAQDEDQFSTAPMVSDDSSDSSLTNKALETVKNIIPSGIEAAKSFAQPFLHPIQTGEAMADIGKGLYSYGKEAFSKTAERDPRMRAANALMNQPQLTIPQDTEEQKAKDRAAVQAVGKFYADRYGGLENIGKTVVKDPVGALMDVGSLATLGSGTLARAPGVLGTASKVLGTVGKVSDPIAMGATALKALPVATAVPFWWKSGSSAKSLMEASRAGAELNPEFLKHLSGIAKPEDALDAIDQAAKQLRDERNAKYQESMQRYQQSPNALYASPITMKTNYNDIMQTWLNQFDKNTRAGKPVRLETQNALNNVRDVINEWRNPAKNDPMSHTIFDLDGLKQRLDELRSGYDKSSPPYAAISAVRNSVYDTINLIDPKYAKIMEDYSNASNVLKDIRKELQGGYNATSVAKVRKLLNSQDNTSKAKLIEILAEKNPDIPYMIAGQELHPLLPNNVRSYIANAASGIAASTINPGFIASFLASSPRVAGATQYVAGVPAGIAAKIAEKVPAPVRQGIYQTGRYVRDAQAEKEPPEAPPTPLEPPPENAEFGTAPFHEEPRPQRASGGRIGGAIMKADALIRAAETAKRNLGKMTEDMLELPDEHITKALAVAKAHI